MVSACAISPVYGIIPLVDLPTIELPAIFNSLDALSESDRELVCNELMRLYTIEDAVKDYRVKIFRQVGHPLHATNFDKAFSLEWQGIFELIDKE